MQRFDAKDPNFIKDFRNAISRSHHVLDPIMNLELKIQLLSTLARLTESEDVFAELKSDELKIMFKHYALLLSENVLSDIEVGEM
jgi:hypothetical protein